MIGSTLSNFEIKSKLGEGGMGEVWLATDTKLGRDVALKLLPAEVAGDADRLARFEREAKVLASMNHPNIAMLFGLETVESTVGEGFTPSHATGPSPTGTGTGSDTDSDAAVGAGGDENSKLNTQHSKLTAPAVTFLVMELASSNISGPLFSVAPDGQSILAGVSASGEQSPYLDLVVGWTEDLEGR